MPPTVADITNRQLDELKWRGFLRSILSSIRGVLSETRERDHRALLDLGIPVLALWGGADDIIPIVCKDRLTAWNPDVQHIVVSGAGHGLIYTHTADLWQELEGVLLTS